MARSDERNTGNKPPRGPALQYANASSYRIEPFETVDSDERASDCPGCRYGVCPRHDERADGAARALGVKLSDLKEQLSLRGLHVMTTAERDELVQLRERVSQAVGYLYTMVSPPLRVLMALEALRGTK